MDQLKLERTTLLNMDVHEPLGSTNLLARDPVLTSILVGRWLKVIATTGSYVPHPI